MQEARLAEALIADRDTVRTGPPEQPPQEVIDGLGFGGINRALPPRTRTRWKA